MPYLGGPSRRALYFHQRQILEQHWIDLRHAGNLLALSCHNRMQGNWVVSSVGGGAVSTVSKHEPSEDLDSYAASMKSMGV